MSRSILQWEDSEFSATPWKVDFKKGFSQWKFWGLRRQINYLLIWIYSYFVPFEIYVYIYIYNILKYYIFSSRNEQYHSLRRLVYLFEFWVFCFVVVSFSIGKEDVPFWEFDMAVTLEGQLQVDSWNLRHPNNIESRASFCFYQRAPGSTSSCLLLSTLCNISMQAWLT